MTNNIYFLFVLRCMAILSIVMVVLTIVCISDCDCKVHKWTFWIVGITLAMTYFSHH